MSEVNPHEHEYKVVAESIIGERIKWCSRCGRVVIGPYKGSNDHTKLVYEIGNKNPILEK